MDDREKAIGLAMAEASMRYNALDRLWYRGALRAYVGAQAVHVGAIGEAWRRDILVAALRRRGFNVEDV